jgi:hypothetical protein
MSRVRPRFDPDYSVPDPRLLKVSKLIWQDPEDFRPWAKMREEIIQLIEVRARSYERDPGIPSREVRDERENVDRALNLRAQCYAKRTSDALSRPSKAANVSSRPTALLVPASKTVQQTGRNKQRSVAEREERACADGDGCGGAYSQEKSVIAASAFRVWASGTSGL